MEKQNLKSLWNKLEMLLSRLEMTTQVWLVEKFIEEARTSIAGTDIRICTQFRPDLNVRFKGPSFTGDNCPGTS